MSKYRRSRNSLFSTIDFSESLPYWVAFLLSFVFGWLSHWKIFEFDLFNNIRAGKELLQNGHLQRVDAWSHTVLGAPCVNFEWLSTVMEYLASLVLPDYAFLAWLRSILVGFVVFLSVRLIQKKSPSYFIGLVLPFLLIPWVYVMCSFRFEMRPDLFATCHFVAFLYLWQSNQSEHLKKTLSCFLLISWANFHSGTVVIGIILYVMFVFFSKNHLSKDKVPSLILWIGAGATTWFITPLGFHVIAVMYEAIFVYDHSILRLHDFQPFSLKLLKFRNGGWVFLLWIPYTLLAFISVLYWYRIKKIKAQKGLNSLQTLLGGVLLTGLTFSKIRVIHYQVIFFLPLISHSLGEYLSQRKSKYFWHSVVPFLALGFFLWTCILPNQIDSISRPIGVGVYDIDNPVNSVKFIKKVRPKNNLLNSYSFGGYLVAELPEYPVAVDGRGTPFQNFIREMQEAISRGRYSSFLNKYKINLVLESLPATNFDKANGFLDHYQVFYPRSEWALVYFDNASVVYLRRIPEHAKIIERHEYQWINRSYPAGYGASFPRLAEATRKAHEREINRCLEELPTNVYCLVGKAAFLRVRGDLNRARELLLVAKGVNARDPSLLLELMGVYKELGQKKAAEATERELKMHIDLIDI
jgi:hypothetical protein